MYFSHLALNDFRSYEAVDVEFDPGVNVLVGPNGQGKTNLVEAVGYIATLSSHRVASDAALVRAGAPRAVIRARIVRGDRASTVELEINPGKSNRARVNRGAATRPRDVLGIARTVTFAPEDLALVKGDPDGRRRFLDQLGVLLLPRYAGILSDYDRVLRQRSALLKSAGGLRFGRSRRTPERALDEAAGAPGDPVPGDSRGRPSPGADGSGADGPGALATLDVWNGRLASLGAQIVSTRLRLVTALGPYVAEAYGQVSAGQGAAVVAYRSSIDPVLEGSHELGPVGRTANGPAGAPGVDGPSVPDDPGAEPSAVESRLLAAMERLRSKELERGQSLVGPHRDDLDLALGGLPTKAYASHGESWSFALALRLASYRLLTDGHDAVPWAAQGPDGEPILVLDDVFAELDVRRRDRLGGLVADAAQVLITAAVPADIPSALDGTHFEVENGTVRRV